MMSVLAAPPMLLRTTWAVDGNRYFGALLGNFAFWFAKITTASSYIFLNTMGGAARTLITALEQLHHHHIYYREVFLLSRAPFTPTPNPTTKTDENPAASAAGGLELAETRSLLHVGRESRVVQFLSLTIKKLYFTCFMR